jgi:DNA recombination protein RmuC
MKHVREFESRNTSMQAGITEQLKNTAAASGLVQREARNLTAALRKPSVRGAWGELSLARALELLGLTEHCDFECQVFATDKDGNKYRPDVVIRMTGERGFPMDSKAPMDAYLAMESGSGEEETRKAGRQHAAALRGHIDELHRRGYHDKIKDSADFTVLYLPLDGMLFAALEHDPDLYQHALAKKILLATPTLLFGLLRAVEAGWRQVAVAENLEQIAGLGRDLYERIAKMAEHLFKLGNSLTGTVAHYNALVGNVQSKMIPGARKFAEFGVADRPLHEITAVETAPRAITSAELLAALPESNA